MLKSPVPAKYRWIGQGRRSADNMAPTAAFASYAMHRALEGMV
jgi:hypothetical protein